MLRSALLLPILFGATLTTLAQETQPERKCGPDEIDVGDYCARAAQDAARLEPGARRATPIRIRSMMPGHADDVRESTPVQEAAVADSARAPGSGGLGVQLGVFSSREKAVAVGQEARSAVGGAFVLARISHQQRILWACIQGPYSDEASALRARQRLHTETRFKEAFIKPLDDLELLDLNHARIEK